MLPWFDVASPRIHRPIAVFVVISLQTFYLSARADDTFAPTEKNDALAPSCSGTRVEQQEQEENAAASLFLLQVIGPRLQFQKHGLPTQQLGLTHRNAREAIDPLPTDYLQNAVPLAWTHVPKCGTSLQNILVRLPGVCPGLPVGDTVFETGRRRTRGSTRARPTKPDFDDQFPDWDEHCPGLKKVGVSLTQHVNVGSNFEGVYSGHGVIMLRNPEQRLMSMYYHATKGTTLDGFPVDRLPDYFTRFTENTIQGARLVEKYNMSLVDFAEATAGCAVRMLTKSGSGWLGCMGVDAHLEFSNDLIISDADVIEARRRLRAYAFVGITEEWEDSVCLMHAMFGGECHPAEFVNVRNGSSTAMPYDTNELQGFVDQHDDILFQEAVSIFTENLRQYNVSKESCRRCFQLAGLEQAIF